ncbi:hypothetical protein ACFWIJ_29290, partial [Streptomyces sp. NPDC127079]
VTRSAPGGGGRGAALRPPPPRGGAPPGGPRPTAAWQRLWDEGQIATRGQELLHMWEHLSAAGLLLEPSHQAMAQAVRTRLERGTASLPPEVTAREALPPGEGPVAPEDKPLKPTRRGLRRFTRRPGPSTE